MGSKSRSRSAQQAHLAFPAAPCPSSQGIDCKRVWFRGASRGEPSHCPKSGKGRLTKPYPRSIGPVSSTAAPRALRRNESPDLPGQRYLRRPSALGYSFPWVRSPRERALHRHPETLDLLRRHESVGDERVHRGFDLGDVLLVLRKKVAPLHQSVDLGWLQFDTYEEPLEPSTAAILARAFGGRSWGTDHWVGLPSPLLYSETRPNLLMLLGLNFAVFSESSLMPKENCSDFDSAIWRFESSRPSQLILFRLSRFRFRDFWRSRERSREFFVKPMWRREDSNCVPGRQSHRTSLRSPWLAGFEPAATCSKQPKIVPRP